MKAKTIFTICIILTGFVSTELFAQGKVGGWDPNKESKESKKENSFQETIDAFLAKDPGMQRFFTSAYGYVVFPSVGKGGFIVGGAHGNGRVYQGGNKIGTAELVQATVGLQAGGQSYSEIIFFKDQQAFDHFKNGNMKFSGQASAIAATAGASADVSYSDGVAVFTMAKGGVMLEASIGGQSFTYKPVEEDQ
jgi:lipid-binding SYLF domain-containing protein